MRRPEAGPQRRATGGAESPRPGVLSLGLAAPAPTFTGHKAFTTANYHSAPVGVEPSAAGFWFTVVARLDSQAVASKTRYLMASMGGAGGFSIRVTGTNSSINPMAYTGSVFVFGNASTLLAGDVGQVHVCTLVHTGTSLRHILDGSEVGTAPAITGMDTTARAMNFGNRTGTAEASDGWTIYCGGGGTYVPTLAEVQAQHAAIKAAFAWANIPAKTDDSWSADATGDEFTSASGTDDAVKAGAALTVDSTLQSAIVWGF